MNDGRMVVAVQLYDNRVVVEWTMYEWIAELEIECWRSE